MRTLPSQGTAWHDSVRLGGIRSGRVWLGRDRNCFQSETWRGTAESGRAWWGLFWRGVVRLGSVWQGRDVIIFRAWCGDVRWGAARCGAAKRGPARLGEDRIISRRG